MSIRILLTTLLTTVVLCSQGQAYILPAPQVVEKAEERLRQLVDSRVLFDGQLKRAEGPDSLSIKSRWSLHGSTEIKVTGDGGQGALWKKGRPPQGVNALLPAQSVRLILHTLLSKGELKSFMMAHGIDSRRQRLTLSGARVAHVIGSSTGSMDRPQIWIDQETFSLLRVIIRHNGQNIDLSLNDWSGPISQGRFPHRVEVVIDGQWSRRLNLLEFHENGGG